MTMKTDWVAVARELGPAFAARAEAHDQNDTFVQANYDELRARRVFSAGVPSELGGGGASHAELCDLLRELAHHCSSTALALSMHMHQVMVPVWRLQHEGAPMEGLLRRVADEQLVLVTSGGSDWLESGGRLEKVDGGYRMTARKVFASGSPGGNLLLTSAVLEDPAEGPTVLHFPLPLTADAVRVLDNWRVLGMRGTGSNDIQIEGAFIPEAAVGLRRPKGKWVPLFHLITLVALPLVYAVYVGIAEKARDVALEKVASKRDDVDVQYGVGEMENSLRSAQIALAKSIDLAAHAQPSPEITNEIAILRTLIGRGVLRTVETAMEVTGGGAFYRSGGLERLFRDVQAARYHPLQERRQLRHTGRFLLGLPVD